ncbi:MAG: DUF357 domain-containing protein [Nanoarchaeota archaeon]
MATKSTKNESRKTRSIEGKIDEQLINETKKWLSRLEDEIPKVKENEQNKEFLKNINAYISDAKFYLKEGKLVYAFEAVVWAWAWLSILRDLKIVE